jgi:hypothetical protein
MHAHAELVRVQGEWELASEEHSKSLLDRLRRVPLHLHRQVFAKEGELGDDVGGAAGGAPAAGAEADPAAAAKAAAVVSRMALEKLARHGPDAAVRRWEDEELLNESEEKMQGQAEEDERKQGLDVAGMDGIAKQAAGLMVVNTHGKQAAGLELKEEAVVAARVAEETTKQPQAVQEDGEGGCDDLAHVAGAQQPCMQRRRAYRRCAVAMHARSGRVCTVRVWLQAATRPHSTR